MDASVWLTANMVEQAVWKDDRNKSEPQSGNSLNISDEKIPIALVNRNGGTETMISYHFVRFYYVTSTLV